MWRAITATSHNHATISTLLRVLILPWAVFGIVAGAGNVWWGMALNKEWSPGWKFYLGLYFSVGIFTDLIFGLIAWR